MSRDDTYGVKLVLIQVQDGEEITCYEEHGLKLINIPGAWATLRANPKDGEQKGYGRARGEVTLDWLYRNYGPPQMKVETIPCVVIESLLKYADNRELTKLFGETLLKLLQEKFGKGE